MRDRSNEPDYNKDPTAWRAWEAGEDPKVHPTTDGSAKLRDGRITIVFGLHTPDGPTTDIEVDVTAYATLLARDLLVAVVDAEV